MPDNQELTMLLVGDMFIQRDDPPSVFQYVAELLRKAEFTFGNLEGASSECSGTLWPKGGPYKSPRKHNEKAPGEPLNSKMDARQLQALESGGFDAVTIANNRIMDFGYEPVRETLDKLDKLGIAHTGAGSNFAKAHAPAIVERKGCKVALLGYTSLFMRGWEAGSDSAGLAVMRAVTVYEPPPRALEVPGLPPKIRTWVLEEDRQQLAEDIEAARRQADIVVCTFHWGVSGGNTGLSDYQIELAHHAIDSGADVIFGHHPHLMNAIEVYKKRPIFYSLGNFSFTSLHNKGVIRAESETMIVRCRIRGNKIAAVEYIPALCDEFRNPHLCDLETGRKTIDLVEKRSAPFGTKFSSDGDYIRIELSA